MRPVEDPAKDRDLNEEIALGDYSPRPARADHLFFWNDVAASRDQGRQNLERPRPERDRHKDAIVVAPEQPTASAVKAKFPEQESPG